MFFFLNENFSAQNSGIEHAQIKRASLFEKFHENYKLIFYQWNPFLHYYLNNSQIKDKNILNMFDFFQSTEKVKNKNIKYQSIDFGVQHCKYERNKDNAYQIIVTKQEKLIGRINLFNKNNVQSVELFDDFGNLYRVDNYDYRGFLSMSQIYTPDNKIGTEVWYNYNGYPVVHDYFRYDNNHDLKRSGWEWNDHGTIRNFDTMTELLMAFLNTVNKKYLEKDKPNIYIMDRSDRYEEILPKLESPAYTVFHIHSSHIGNAQEPMTSIMNNNYEYSLFNMNHYDATITATKKQRHDIIERFKPITPVFEIPVGIINNKTLKQKKVIINERIPHSIAVTARISPEKKIEHIIKSVEIAKKQFKDITLDIYGYINDHDYMDKLKETINNNNLKPNVKFHNYTKNIKEVQQKHQLYISASTMEGFSLSLMEAQSNGDVGVTYDTNYGPNELVQDKVNGFVVKYGDYNELANKIIELFNNKSLLQKMSDEAYKLSDRYSEESVWQCWKYLINTANKKWSAKMSNYRPNITSGTNNMEDKNE